MFCDEDGIKWSRPNFIFPGNIFGLKRKTCHGQIVTIIINILKYRLSTYIYAVFQL